MASLGDILANIASTISEATGLRVIPYISDNPPAPCVLLYPERCDYSATFGRGYDEWTIKARLLLPMNSDRAAQDELAEWLSGAGSRSIRQAIYQAPTLGTSSTESTADSATTMTAHVSEMTDFGTVTTLENVRLLSADLTIRVLAKGNA